MATTIVEITATKIHCIVPNEHAHKIASDVQITDVFQLHGIAMETTIAVMVLMSHQSTVNLKEEHASVICLLVTMAIAFHVFTFVMVIMIAWTTATKITDISAVSICFYR